MYEDENTDKRYITVVFAYVSDDENDPQMRGELVERIEQLCEDFGCDAEIHNENMLAEPVR